MPGPVVTGVPRTPDRLVPAGFNRNPQFHPSGNAFPLVNTFEGGTAGQAITPGTSGGASGNAFDAVTVTGAGNAVLFDATHSYDSVAMQVDTTHATGTEYVEWSTALGPISGTHFGRAYFYMTANPANALGLVQYLNGASVSFSIIVLIGGQIRITDNAGASVLTTGTTIGLNQWVRIEWKIVHSATAGQGELKLFNSPDSVTETELQTSAASFNTLTQHDRVRLGHYNSSVSTGSVYWLDNLGVAAPAYMGPVVPPDVTVSPPAATASASAPPAGVDVQVPPPVATASASALVPTVTGGGASVASFVADLFAPVANVTSSTTMTATTAVTVASGDSAIIEAGARGGTTTAQSCSLSGLPGDAVVETSPDISASGSPAVQMFRVYFPSGMASGTVITFTWVQSATRKGAAGQVITGLANSNGIWQTATPGGTASLTAGTTAATTTTTGWHTAAWWYQSATGTFTVTPGSDVEGAMTERADFVVGASAFGYLYAEDRSVSAAHAGGETATATISSAAASSVGVQGVWDGGVGVTVNAPTATASASSPTPIPGVTDSLSAATAAASAPTPALQVQVPAPAATANASAPLPAVQLRVAPPVATAAASALTPTLPVSAAVATAAASAPVPSVQLQVAAPAATAAASSPVPVPQLRVLPPAASANASAPVPAVLVGIVVPVATASANGPPPVPQLVVLAPAATASASAPVPNVVSGTLVAAPAATAAASAPTPTVQLQVAPPAATASASAPTPVPQVKVSPPVASAAASAPSPIAPAITPPAATASASSPTFTLQDAIIVPRGTASASAPVPFVSTAPIVVVPSATASASSPTPTVQLRVSPPAATAAASAPLPTVQLQVSPAAASASASAPTPTISVSVLAPAASASASSPTSTPQLRVLPPAASASASAPTPTVTTNPVVSPPAATATASAPTPTLQLRVLPGVASASASAPVPAVQAKVLPPAATAIASAPTPTVSSAFLQPPTTTPLTGFVYGTPASGTVTPEGDTGLVTVSLKGMATLQGDTGLPGWAFPTTRVTTLGYSNQVLGGVVVGDVETLIGRQFHGLRQNQAYTTTGVSTAVTEYDAGRTTSYRSIQFDTAPGGWAAVATGVADTQLTAFCNAVIAANRWTAQNPFLVCLHHEATLSPFGTAGFSATDYKAMWAHCVPFMLATGAPIAFALVGWDRMFVGANGVGPPTAGQGIGDLDPGSSLYTYIGSDVYNAIDSPGVLRYGLSASTLLEPIRLAAVARGKDWMIGEMGCEDGTTTQDHVNKARWLDSLRVYLDGLGATGPGVCRVMMTTIKASAENYNVDSSAESLAAWQRLGHDTYYA